MNNKIICMIACIMLLTTFFPALLALDMNIPDDYNIVDTSSLEFVLDQKQELHNEEIGIHLHKWIAQSFRPTMTPLTKIDIKINKPVIIQSTLEVVIMDDFNGRDLSSISIPSSQVPFYTNWLEVDIPDIEVKINKTYYIVLRSATPSGMSYRWLYQKSTSDSAYNRGNQWESNDYGDTWKSVDSTGFYFDSTFRTYSYDSKSDLECIGLLNWSGILPGEVVTGSFIIKNIGTPLSYLNWRILQWPSWGTWTFSQINGSRLKPEDGDLNIQITVQAPHSGIPDTYLGRIRIINIDDEEDLCFIDASMITPKNKNIFLEHTCPLINKIINTKLFNNEIKFYRFPLIKFLLK